MDQISEQHTSPSPGILAEKCFAQCMDDHIILLLYNIYRPMLKGDMVH